MNYSFDVEIARSYGVSEAIFIGHISWWIGKNAANNKHFYTTEVIDSEGEIIPFSGYFTYNSMKAFEAIFPFWTAKQIRKVIERCKKQNLIYTASINTKKYDRTLWYTLSEKGKTICPIGQIDQTKRANGCAQKGEPIPVINTVNNLSGSSESGACHGEFFEEDQTEKRTLPTNKKPANAFSKDSDPYLLARFLENEIRAHSPQFPESEANRQRWAKDMDLMIRVDKLDPDDIAAVIEWCQNDDFWRSNILSGKKLRQQYLQLSMKMKSKRR